MEIKLEWEIGIEGVQSSTELVFACDCVYSRNVADCLMEMHSYECLGGHEMIGPAYIPSTVLGFIDYHHPQRSGCLSNHWIMSNCIALFLHAVLIIILLISPSLFRFRSFLGAFDSYTYESSFSAWLFYEC